MNNEVASQDNKGFVEKIGQNFQDFFTGTKEGVVNKGSEAMSASSQIVSSAVNNITIENARRTFVNNVTNSSSSIYFILILLILAAIVCYIIYYIIVENILYQKRILITGTEAPILCSKYSEISFSDVLEGGNGNKRSYCFWLYIFNINDNTGSHRHVATITDEKNNQSNIEDSSLCMRLAKDRNALELRFGLNNTFIHPKEDLKYNADKDSFLYVTKDDKKYLCGVEIEYIPIQRWVHVGVVMNDTGGGTITTYIDGNFVKTVSNKTESKKNAEIDVSILNLDHVGKLYVGGKEGDEKTPLGFSGLFSRFTIFNYDLNRNDMYREYSAGPIKGTLSSLGLAAYGLRNPIYKLTNSDTVVYY
jgi:hypothetical protein